MACVSKVRFQYSSTPVTAEALGNYARGLWDVYRRETASCLIRLNGGSTTKGAPPPTAFLSGLVGGQLHFQVSDLVNGVASGTIPSSRAYRFRWTGTRSNDRCYLTFRNASAQTLNANVYSTGNALQPVDTSVSRIASFRTVGNDYQAQIRVLPGYWYYVDVVAAGGGIGSGTRQLTLEMETYA